MSEPTYAVDLRGDLSQTPTVVLQGELDLAARPELLACFERALAAHPDAIDVDLAEVSFIDSSALSVLVEAFGRLQERDGRLTVTAASPFAMRTLEISGLAPYLLPTVLHDGAISPDRPTPTGDTPVAT